MEIKYQKMLQNNPVIYQNSITLRNVGNSLEEITQLEQTYNNGNPFPQSLKEVLYLAGENCYVLDLVKSAAYSQELQNEFFLEDEITPPERPFFVIDLYNAGDQFLFVYLDEGENPPVYQYLVERKLKGRDDYIYKLKIASLSDYIDGLIHRTLKGQALD